ncbi:MAG TPA: hypothetical protein VG895_00155 [Patescibacteria group bacterium]|nr:hypothetical protein [Gammaproteobacteria bacterium]HWA51454.1 hypothetical protein [Patescibacteria group bacterium]
MTSQKKIDDPKSSPEARAKRLRKLRNLANLTRKEMCEHTGIKIDTLIGWEVARHGGLSENGAQKVIGELKKEGVMCTADWLLYEIGQGPTIIPNFENVMLEPPPNSKVISDQDKHIIEELIYFRNHNPGSVDLVIHDDSMNPCYQKGDYVAGIKRYKDDIQSVIGLDCIVQTADGKLLLRKLLTEGNSKKFNLICTNINSNISDPIVYNIDLIYAAAVIWHRKKNP